MVMWVRRRLVNVGTVGRSSVVMRFLRVGGEMVSVEVGSGRQLPQIYYE